ncbi:unnamed protein product [Menidia menidia]|uniref:(Atlantic silverside) hypothetical protein n=1 Tax=Menidia menidia TaxID=238744 RepID=A0A8S4B1D7_9TELE|nr:unnamed protein product [Menidia menidia]
MLQQPYCSTEVEAIDCWTEWFDSSEPSGSGSTENFARIARKYPGKICPNPIDIEARTLFGLTPEAAGDVIEKSSTNSGFTCRRRNQPNGRCNDYKVRFSCPPPYCAELVCWTKWYDRDHPSGSGDWETLGNLRDENPGEICEKPHYIEVVTTDTMTPAIYTGENFHIYNPTSGFVCRKVDQQRNICRDYKVRFGCPCNH